MGKATLTKKLYDKASKVYLKIVNKPGVKKFSKKYDNYWSVVSGEKTQKTRQQLSGVVDRLKRMHSKRPATRKSLFKYPSYRKAYKKVLKSDLQRIGYIGGTTAVTTGGIRGLQELHKKK